MKYILNRNAFKESVSINSVLFIVDVQKSFKKFFTNNYVLELQKYSKQFGEVFQIWDNHIHGEVSSRNYATNPNPNVPKNFDLYKMSNTKDFIEKRYFYLDNIELIDFFSERVDEKTKTFLEKGEFNKGDYFKTLEGTTMVYVDNKHGWFEVPIKLENIIADIIKANKDVVLVGGADGECLLDICNAFDHFGLKYKLEHGFIYSATNCPK